MDKRQLTITEYIRNVRHFIRLKGDAKYLYGPHYKEKISNLEEKLRNEYGLTENDIFPRENFTKDDGSFYIGRDVLEN